MTYKFQSEFKEIGECKVPENTGIRVMMMPLIIGKADSIPEFLTPIKEFIINLCKFSDYDGDIGYLTFDCKTLYKNDTHRRAGLHVDGVFDGKWTINSDPAYKWKGGWRDGIWGAIGTGMLTVSSIEGCRAWNKEFEGVPEIEGDCSSLASQCTDEDAVIFRPNTVYWLDGLCVHESLPQPSTINRTFVRLSNPSMGPWFKGYTENPLGIDPSGQILERRIFL